MSPGRKPELADILDRLAIAARSLMDSDAPIGADGDCYLCVINVERDGNHDPDCGWQIARHLAPSDLDAVRRLARALRYTRGDV